MLFGVELAFREIVLDENILQDCSIVDESNLVHQPQHDDKGDILSTISNVQDECDEDHAVLFLGIIIERRLFRFFIYFAALLCIGTYLNK
jgi:hypothetical protein